MPTTEKILIEQDCLLLEYVCLLMERLFVPSKETEDKLQYLRILMPLFSQQHLKVEQLK